MRSLRATVAAVAAALTLGVVAGCTPSQPASTPTLTPIPTPTPVVLPLTGVAANELPAHPAVSVKIPADRGARPQTGLADADNVWVELVEGGEVRYNAVYYSHLPEVVGPVRSVRPVDALINAPLGGVLLASGGQPDFLREVSAAVGTLLTEDSAGDAAWRTKDRRIPYNLYGSVAKAAAKGEGLEPPKPQWRFGKTPGGDAITDLTLAYPGWASRWEWTGDAWARSDNGQPTEDADGRRVSATTVIALKVATHATAYRDPVGAPVIATDLVGSGEARVAVGGTLLTATWRKDQPTDPVTLSDGAGKPLALPSGPIWIELVPDSPSWVSATPAPAANPTASKGQ